MPSVYPFKAVHYAKAGTPTDVSDRVAPPYDVLDAEAKNALIAKNANNVVSIDLPHIPAKELGPPEAYQNAADSFRNWLDSGVLEREDQPAMFVYRETFHFMGQTHQRTGMACTVETLPFGPRDGGGILPHEQTFSGPKEDRFALMRAANAQFSPIFGLHTDDDAQATNVLQKVAASRTPDFKADLGDGVLHEVWMINDDDTINAYKDALAGDDVFIADGHHRYNTALNYLAKLEEEQGSVPADHPARRCLIVLVSMSDPGMVIGPTHRVLGGMSNYEFAQFEEAAQDLLNIAHVGNDPHELDKALNASTTPNTLGLHDFATGNCYLCHPKSDDPLKATHSDRDPSWRSLDVAIVQHLIVEQICEPKLNNGQPVKWAFPHSIEEVIEIGQGKEKGSGGGKSFTPQLAVIVKPTPLDSVRDVSKANELMPQKSTFFYPKLATGLFINLLEK